MARTDRERLIALARRRGWLSAHEVARAGIHSQHLTGLVADGVLERARRGLYRLAGSEVTEHHGLVAASAAAPGAVICLLSALSFHGIGSQLPAEVWLAIARGSRPPKLPYPRLRVLRYSGAAFREGIEIHELEARRVKVYSVAKTIADLFKARHQVGLVPFKNMRGANS